MKRGPSEHASSKRTSYFGLSNEGEPGAEWAREVKVKKGVVLGHEKTLVIIITQDGEPDNIDGVFRGEEDGEGNVLGRKVNTLKNGDVGGMG
jgi:hypothetical protein